MKVASTGSVRHFVERVRFQYPTLLLSHRATRHDEGDGVVLGFAGIWLLTGVSLLMLGWRLSDLAKLTSRHWLQALASAKWRAYVGLLITMGSAAHSGQIALVLKARLKRDEEWVFDWSQHPRGGLFRSRPLAIAPPNIL